MDKTASGLDQNIAAALTYALGWITGAIFLLTEPSNKFVRFHALQSLIVFGGLSLIWFVAISSVPIIGFADRAGAPAAALGLPLAAADVQGLPG